MTPAQIEAFVGAVADALKLPIAPEHRPEMNHPRSGFAAPLEGATPADRRSRIRGGRMDASLRVARVAPAAMKKGGRSRLSDADPQRIRLH